MGSKAHQYNKKKKACLFYRCWLISTTLSPLSLSFFFPFVCLLISSPEKKACRQAIRTENYQSQDEKEKRTKYWIGLWFTEVRSTTPLTNKNEKKQEKRKKKKKTESCRNTAPHDVVLYEREVKRQKKKKVREAKIHMETSSFAPKLKAGISKTVRRYFATTRHAWALF